LLEDPSFEDASFRRLVKALQARFGTEKQAPAFKAQLRARTRRANESLQSYYQEICHLTLRAFPGRSNEATSEWALDAFINGLNDPDLQRRLWDKEPKTVEGAYAEAQRQISISGEQSSYSAHEKQDRRARAVSAPVQSKAESDALIKVAELEKQLAACKAAPVPSLPNPHPQANPFVPTSQSSDTCRYCKSPGHTIRECLKKQASDLKRQAMAAPPVVNPSMTPAQQPSAPQPQVVSQYQMYPVNPSTNPYACPDPMC